MPRSLNGSFTDADGGLGGSVGGGGGFDYQEDAMVEWRPGTTRI